MTTRTQHLDWCKQRAMEYCNNGDTHNAMASIMSDLTKHEETEDHSAIQLGMMLMFAGHLKTQRDVKQFIEGIN